MLKEAIASVQCQTLEDWELILSVDHHKSVVNETTDICYNYAMAEPRIKLVFTDLEPDDLSVNRFARNINLAFPHTTGRFLTYLCDDDLLMPWKFTVFGGILDENPQIEIVYGKQMIYDVPTKRFTAERGLFGVTNSAAGQVNHNSPMHRRHCFDEVGGWNEHAPSRFGDAYFWARLNEKWPFHPIDCVGEIQRMGDFNCWSGKPQSEAEKVNVGAFA